MRQAYFPLLAFWVAVAAVAAEKPAAPTAEQLQFFETKIRPVLIGQCYECHAAGAKILKGGLRLDHRAGLLHGGDSGPAIVPGKPAESLLLKALQHDGLEMPPRGKLPEAIIRDFETWIAQGAPDPRQADDTPAPRATDIEAGRQFWAFRPIADPALPAVNDRSWSIDPLDQFVLARLEQVHLKPIEDADRYTWLRRVSLDLTGLPPGPAEIEAFIRDNSPRACEAVVDRLLGTKAYGERWARHWLDLTGYADMMGTSNSVFAEHAWRYRDYLIEAFNADKPFDEFIREQIAGDLMPATSTEDRAENIVATGFLMVGDIEIVNPDKAKMETDHIDTQVIKIGQAFLAMTLGCARCHDHKFDPISLQDYYGIAGMLRSSPSSHKMPDMGVWSTLNSVVLPETPAQLDARKQLEAENQERITSLKAEQRSLTDEKAAISKQLTALGNLSEPSQQVATNDSAQRESTPAGGIHPSPDKDALTKRRDELDAQLKKLGAAINHAEFFKDKTPRAFAMGDGPEPDDMPIYIRGNPYSPGTVVPRGSVRVASWDEFPAIPTDQSGRLQLADWLADKRNPLTARVTVNRIWQKLFGTGIVPSVDYFGVRGDAPTNLDLLDHLATRFMQGEWSQKAFIRALVLSRTYRLSSANDVAAMKLDPENMLYWRMNRQRLDAEAVRDSLLAVSGELTRDSGGPALVLENPENCGALALKGVNPPNYTHKAPRPAQEFERTLYLPVMRNGFAGQDRLRGFFDFINPAMIAGERPQTIVPTQSLFLLNNDLLRKRATALAKTLLADEKNDLARLETLWLRVLNRPITRAECDEATAFLNGIKSSDKPSELVSWTELCHSLLASNEFVFRL